MDKYIRSKSSFVLGLVTGIAIVSTLGFVVFGGLVVRKELNTNGSLFGAAAGEEQDEDQDGEEVVDVDAGDTGQPTQPSRAAQPDTAAKVDIKVASSDHVRGKKNAPITIVEFSDFQCPFCQRFHTTMKQVMANYPDKVRWVYKHFPLESIHPLGRKAAQASECASEQGKFWEYADKVYENQATMSDQAFADWAEDLGLDSDKFSSCLSSAKYNSRVSADLSQGQAAGVRGTPGSFINGQSIPGAVPYEQVEAMIENLL